MLPFLYRCPVTGLNVQGLGIDKTHTGDDPGINSGMDSGMRTVMCLACRRIHIVKPLMATEVAAAEAEKQVDRHT